MTGRRWLHAAVAALVLTGSIQGNALSADNAPKIPGDIGFRDRLASGQIVFANEALLPDALGRPSDDYVIIRDQAADAAVSAILERLIAAHDGPKPTRLPFFLVQSPNVNCSATANASAIVCTTHMMDIMARAGEAGESQLAFVLAHELSHIVIASHRKRFDKSNMTRAEFAKAGMFAAMAAYYVAARKTRSGNTLTITATTASQSMFWDAALGGVDAGETVDGFLTPTWSKADEAEADAYAMVLLHRASYDESQAAQLLGTLAAEQAAQNAKNGGVFGTVAKEALTGAAGRALLSQHSSWVDVGLSGFLKGFAAYSHANSHYHGALGQRVAFCVYEAQMDAPLPDERSLAALFSQADSTPPSPVVAAAPAPAPSAPLPSKGRRKVSVRTQAKVAAAALSRTPLVVETAWQRFLRLSAPARAEAEMADQVHDTLLTRGAKAAAALCPDRPITGHLAFICGLAQAGIKNRDAASALFRQTLADSYANTGEFRAVAQAEASDGDTEQALATLKSGNDRFGDGRFYPDQISIQAEIGDEAGAKATAETCKLSADKVIASQCTLALASAKHNDMTKG